MAAKCRADFERKYVGADYWWNALHQCYSREDIEADWDAFQTAWMCGYAASLTQWEKE